MLAETTSSPQESGDSTKIIVSFRGTKCEIVVTSVTLIRDVKNILCSSIGANVHMAPSDLKLLCKGNVLSNEHEKLLPILSGGKKLAKVYRIMATGVSQKEALTIQQNFKNGQKAAPRIRDDLSSQGKQDIARRKMLGRAHMKKAAKKYPPRYQTGFGRIETLPFLPEESRARELLTKLANDPGIRACMDKHGWNVGCLAELYPEGEVGVTDKCVLGLNQNKGQKILLRLRTDDLQGFRKMLSIRKVLFHELAHNVHSEHNQDFFVLMRQIERECIEMDWTQGQGLTRESDDIPEGGTYRLGGNSHKSSNLSARELAARAAMMRLTTEEREIQDNCGCGRESC